MAALVTTLTQIKIETYWNVNAGMQAWTGLLATIKIETYWNVNGIGRNGG